MNDKRLIDLYYLYGKINYGIAYYQLINNEKELTYENLKQEIESLFNLNSCENDFQKAKQELQESNNRCDEEWNVIISQCRRIQDDSFKASNIPRWEEHLFRKDQYEMTKEEGNRLINLLHKVAENEVVDLAESIENYSEMSKENQQLRSNLSEEEYVLRQFTEYQDKLTKLINTLN